MNDDDDGTTSKDAQRRVKASRQNYEYSVRGSLSSAAASFVAETKMGLLLFFCTWSRSSVVHGNMIQLRFLFRIIPQKHTRPEGEESVVVLINLQTAEKHFIMWQRRRWSGTNNMDEIGPASGGGAATAAGTDTSHQGKVFGGSSCCRCSCFCIYFASLWLILPLFFAP